MIAWDDLRHFLAVHREGTLARAGVRLGIDPTTVGRRLAVLEGAAGARLFDRTPGGYAITPAGRDLLPRAERMEREALALERELSGRDERLAGVVRVSVTEMMATRFIAPHLARFSERHPEVSLSLECTNRVVSLARREADIALRLARPVEENLIARRLSRIELGLYASPTYLAARGAPEAPDEHLRGHRVLLFDETRAFAVENRWFAPLLDGATVALRSDSVSSLYSAAVGGLGIALLPRVVADLDPLLAGVATRTSPEPRVIWQMVHRDLAKAPRVRAVYDFLGKVLRGPRPPAR
jgi:DNA-binding transcriptional LysR family regulator